MIFWGMLLVAVGGLLLADQAGLLPAPAVTLIVPVALVLLGARIVFGALAGRRGAPAEPLAVPLDSAPSARVVFRHGGGRLDLGPGAEPGALLSGTFVGGVDHRETRGAEGLVADLRVRESAAWAWDRYAGRGLDWYVRLAEDVPLALELHIGASDNHLDLTRLRVTELTLATGASSTVVALPAAAGVTRVRVNAGAAGVRLRVPEGVAARVQGRAGVGAIDVDSRRFPAVGSGAWLSPDYAHAANRVEIEAEVGVGSIRIE